MIIIYHDNCHDGITAAWVALKKYPEAELYPGKFDDEPDLERLRDRDVLIVDFSWKRFAMLQIAEVAKSVRVFDHHASAQAELAGLDWCVFDMERSGAGITWDELFPNRGRPDLVSYVEDRDLWRFALPMSREVHAACASWPLDLEHRTRLMHTPIVKLLEEGDAILRYHNQLVEQACKYVTRATIAGFDVPCIALPVISLVSDAGHRLCKGEPFAALYTRRADGTAVVQLRSEDGGQDVSKIAVRFGGGGHPHAAGFTVKHGSFPPTAEDSSE